MKYKRNILSLAIILGLHFSPAAQTDTGYSVQCYRSGNAFLPDKFDIGMKDSISQDFVSLDFFSFLSREDFLKGSFKQVEYDPAKYHYGFEFVTKLFNDSLQLIEELTPRKKEVKSGICKTGKGLIYLVDTFRTVVYSIRHAPGTYYHVIISKVIISSCELYKWYPSDTPWKKKISLVIAPRFIPMDKDELLVFSEIFKNLKNAETRLDIQVRE